MKLRKLYIYELTKNDRMQYLYFPFYEKKLKIH